MGYSSTYPAAGTKPLRTFHGGVHPDDQKQLSEQCAIEPVPVPERLYVPMQQHLGTPCEPAVPVGVRVRRGDVIGQASGFVSAPVHAPTSGTITGFVSHPVTHPSGLSMLCAVLESDGKDEWTEGLTGVEDPFAMEPALLRDRVRAAGIVGLGGATFPSFIKLSPPQGKPVERLIVNGVECEPYLTCDSRIMVERAADLVDGILLVLHILQSRHCTIGIEANKPEAIRVMQAAVARHEQIAVAILPVMYPQGSEKQLIEVLTGRQVPVGSLPIDVGVVVHNVATVVAVHEAIRIGHPMTSRVVTVSGRGIVRPANLEVRIGTPTRHLIEHCGGVKPGVARIISGGPMMGIALHSLEEPVVKGSSGILALLESDVPMRAEQACIRCGYCVGVCPEELVPCDLALWARHDDFDRMTEYDLFSCIECGSCSYVCPAHIPLVHYFRYGKMTIHAREREQQKLEHSRQRTQEKAARVAQEQAERERKKLEMKAKAAAGAAARKASATPAADTPEVAP
jgi:electron transport complex protein RnfC